MREYLSHAKHVRLEKEIRKHQRVRCNPENDGVRKNNANRN